MKDSVTLESNFTDLFVDAATFDKSANKNSIKCYLPIFPNKLVSGTPGADEWFIGTKFLGKKTLVFDNVYQRDKTESPRIGFGNQSTSAAG